MPSASGNGDEVAAELAEITCSIFSGLSGLTREGGWRPSVHASGQIAAPPAAHREHAFAHRCRNRSRYEPLARSTMRAR
jgi:hypothetical protein